MAQFAPAMLGGMYWKGATRHGAMAGLLLGFGLWAYTLMLPSLAKSGWLAAGFLSDGPWGIALLKPEQLLGLSGLDNLTHSLFWSLLANVGAYLVISLWRSPDGQRGQPGLAVCRCVQAYPEHRPGVLARARPGAGSAVAGGPLPG
ncbi:hypothetical protein LP416_08785 [Polaromonas sp. P2-4]|nr:hypothetical protein LP416_08785 [Polaromonas sp. P2-4]